MTENGFRKLSLRIKEFDACAYHVFSDYEPSRLGTKKFQILDYLCHDLRVVGHIEYLHACIYEAAHNRFEEIHRLIPKRHASATREVLNKHGVRTNDGTFQSKVNSENVKPRTTQQKTKQSNKTGHFWLKWTV